MSGGDNVPQYTHTPKGNTKHMVEVTNKLPGQAAIRRGCPAAVYKRSCTQRACGCFLAHHVTHSNPSARYNCTGAWCFRYTPQGPLNQLGAAIGGHGPCLKSLRTRGTSGVRVRLWYSAWHASTVGWASVDCYPRWYKTKYMGLQVSMDPRPPRGSYNRRNRHE